MPLRYIRALNSPCLVLEDTFDVKQSVPLDVLITSDRAELLIALAAVVDEYFQDVRLSLSEYKLTFKELVNFLVKEASRA